MEQQYLNLLRIALDGNRRTCRNGETRAIFAVQLRHDMRQGFPLLTTKAMKPTSILGELLWFIEGGRNSPVPYRMDNNRLREIQGLAPDKKTIWSHDCEKPEWLKKAVFPGDCGRIYGSQWRDWNGKSLEHGSIIAAKDDSYGAVVNPVIRSTRIQGIDQLSRLVALIKNDPTSRYMKVTAWNPSELSDMCLPPCHGDFQCFVQTNPALKGKASRFLSLHMVQRSCDLFLGVPYNIASYGYLLTMLAQVTGCVAHELVITLNDAHVYEAHVEAVQTQLRRTPGRLPELNLDPMIKNLDDFTMKDFRVYNYNPQEAIKAPLL